MLVQILNIISNYEFIEIPKSLNYANGDQYIAFYINLKTRPGDINKLLVQLPSNSKLSFYDDKIPQWSDPGAYYSVVKKNRRFYLSAGNHGWSTKYAKLSLNKLSQLIVDCISFNNSDDQKFKLSECHFKLQKYWFFSKGLPKDISERINRLNLALT